MEGSLARPSEAGWPKDRDMNHGALSPTLSHQDGQQENARGILFSKKMQYLMLSPHHPSPSPTLDISLQSRSPCQVLSLRQMVWR